MKTFRDISFSYVAVGVLNPVVGKTVKNKKYCKTDMGGGNIKSQMFKLDRKKKGVKIWNKNPEYLSVRGV